MKDVQSKSRKRQSVALTPAFKKWLTEELAAKRKIPQDLVQVLNGRLSAKIIYEMFNPNSTKLRFDRKSLFLVGEEIGIPQAKLLSASKGEGCQWTSEAIGDSKAEMDDDWNVAVDKSHFFRLLGIREAVLLMPLSGEPTSALHFQLDTTQSYVETMPASVRALMDEAERGWSPDRDGRYSFRLESITHNDRQPTSSTLLKVSLVPANLHRVLFHTDNDKDVHGQLIAEMRAECLRNDLTCYSTGSRPLLPSLFSSKTAIITADRKLFLQREESLDSITLENGITTSVDVKVGYQMWPETDFHIEHCNCRMSSTPFFKPHRFFDFRYARGKAYSVIFEREAPVPILISVYHASERFDQLEELWSLWKPDSVECDSIELTPDAVGALWKNLKPRCRIAATYALLSIARSRTESDAILRQLSRCVSDTPSLQGTP